MRGLFRLPRWAALLLLALAAVLVAMPPAQAQGNSREAAEAARKHRAEKARGATPAPQRATESSPGALNRPYRSSANPNADPRLSLRSCLDNVGMNPVARDRCMRQHCEGRWGQGDCPEGGDLMNRAGANSNTPLGRCLREAGANPFKRDACGWRHCNRRWDTPECAALQPRDRELAN